MSSNLDNHKSSVRDIAKLFAEEKRFGTKASDLVNGTALTKCLEINEAFEVLGTPAEQRVAMLASRGLWRCGYMSRGVFTSLPPSWNSSRVFS